MPDQLGKNGCTTANQSRLPQESAHAHLGKKSDDGLDLEMNLSFGSDFGGRFLTFHWLEIS